MERYDGKTKKDDYIKYGLIAAAVILVVVGLSLLTRHLKKTYQKEPDYTVVIGSEEAFGETVQEDLERMLAALVGDLNGDGEALVELKVLRLTDYAQAKLDQEAAEEAYFDALEAGAEASMTENFSGLTMDDDFNQLLLMMTTGQCDLFILSDQPRGSFRGAATTYCEAGYFLELPEELRDEDFSSRCDISQAPFWKQLGYEDISFYACVLDTGDSQKENFAVKLIPALKNANISIW